MHFMRWAQEQVGKQVKHVGAGESYKKVRYGTIIAVSSNGGFRVRWGDGKRSYIWQRFEIITPGKKG
jgi:hypothetical protein